MEYGNHPTDLPVFERRAPGAPAFQFKPSRINIQAAAPSSSTTASSSYWSSAPSAVLRQADLARRRQTETFADLGTRGFARDNARFATGAESASGTDGLRRPDAQDSAIPFSRLSHAFFSAENEEDLQEGLRAGVYDLSMQPGHTGPPFDIARQDPAALRAVMRDIYLTRYADAVPAGADLAAQIGVFNAWVWRTMVPTLYSAARQQHHYLTHFRETIPMTALTRQTDRDFHDDIDGRNRLQFSSMIAAPKGALALAAGRNQFMQSLRRDPTSNLKTDRGNINRLTADGFL